MRCVVDLQGAQGESRFRGIGRYCFSLTMAMARQSKGHEVWLALSGAFPKQVERLRAAFDGVIPQERIVVYDVPTPCAEMDPANEWRARAAERVREYFLEGLKPDLVFLPSLFEGWSDDSVTSVGSFAKELPTAVVVYDLIPFLRPNECLRDTGHKAWYQRKLTSLRSAALLTAISESSRQEAIEDGGFPQDRVVNIGCGVDAKFRPLRLGAAQRTALRSKYGIDSKYVMYSGAVDAHKNVDALIEAFALLPTAVRNGHQLVLVGSHNANEQELVLNRVQVAGLPRKAVVFTGYVSDEDLIALYSECALFVLPSFHEGFGLPAAEAMACGAPTIGSDATSIPEVIGRADALFDPRRPRAIAAKMEEVFTNSAMQQQLREHGLVRSKLFTWENSATRAWAALEELHLPKSPKGMGRHAAVSSVSSRNGLRPKLAYFSPLSPVPSGIAEYSAELLPALAQHYEIDAIAFQPSVNDAWVNANCKVRSPGDFEDNSGRYDRILYHMGNSPFHAHMWRLIELYPGTVVLHDFFQSNVVDWVERDAGVSGAFQRELYRAHGYGALFEEKREAREWATRVFPCNRRVLDAAAGIIVHSRHSIDLAEQWYGDGAASEWVVIPHLRKAQTPDRARARKQLGFADNDYVVCSFGMIADTKLNHRLLAAWGGSSLARDPKCKLVFVGEMHGGEYGRQLQRDIKANHLDGVVQCTGYADAKLYCDYLSAADQAVQLRTHTRGETSRAVLDCLANGVPVIVNAHGCLRDLPAGTVVALSDEFEDAQLSGALESLREHPEVRRQLSANGLELIRSRHQPSTVAEQYFAAIEHFANNHWRHREEALVKEIGAMERQHVPGQSDLMKTATAMANSRVRHGQRQLLLDISATAKDDLKTGIERVARSIILEALQEPPTGFRVEPIRNKEGRYFYARNMTLGMVGAQPRIPETPVEVRREDVYLALDWSPEAICASRPFFDNLRARGIRICFVVHDLLPLHMPHRFLQGLDQVYRSWLETIVSVADKLIAVSRTTADELVAWLDYNRPERLRPLQVCYSHHGADIQAGSPSKGLPEVADQVLSAMRVRPSFLTVGTLEPRKGHSQVLSAFEQLWAGGIDVALVIVGKQGWMMEKFAERIRQHREFGRRLFWLVGISDEMLLRVYEHAAALIAASEGEGFGLPLIEASRAGVPLIARDLPVFREVAREHAFYFKGEAPEVLFSALRQWLDLRAQGAAPKSENLRWIGWKESTRHLMDLVMGDASYREWPPRETQREESRLEAGVCKNCRS